MKLSPSELSNSTLQKRMRRHVGMVGQNFGFAVLFFITGLAGALLRENAETAIASTFLALAFLSQSYFGALAKEYITRIHRGDKDLDLKKLLGIDDDSST